MSNKSTFQSGYLLHLHKNTNLSDNNRLRKKLVSIKKLNKDRNPNKNFKFSKRMTFVKVWIITSIKRQNKCFTKVKTEE